MNKTCMPGYFFLGLVLIVQTADTYGFASTCFFSCRLHRKWGIALGKRLGLHRKAVELSSSESAIGFNENFLLQNYFKATNLVLNVNNYDNTRDNYIKCFTRKTARE